MRRQTRRQEMSMQVLILPVCADGLCVSPAPADGKEGGAKPPEEEAPALPLPLPVKHKEDASTASCMQSARGLSAAQLKVTPSGCWWGRGDNEEREAHSK